MHLVFLSDTISGYLSSRHTLLQIQGITLPNFKPGIYCLALLDIRMHKMNGFELYKKIKDIDKKVEACFITAYEDYREEFKESFPELEEAKYFIRKPKAIEDLVKHVATILG